MKNTLQLNVNAINDFIQTFIPQWQEAWPALKPSPAGFYCSKSSSNYVKQSTEACDRSHARLSHHER